jgi:hypothetical protein
MGNIGRYVCVALPFILCVCSLIALIVSGLAGVADKNLWVFQVDTKNLSVDPLDLSKLFNLPKDFDPSKVQLPKVDIPVPTSIPVPSKRTDYHDKSLLGTGNSGTNTGANRVGANTGASGSGNNITAAELGLADKYDVSIWNYCYTNQAGARDCTKPTFDWATQANKDNRAWVDQLFKNIGQNVSLSKEVNDALDAFTTVTRWTQIVFIIAYVLLGVELVIGLFASCSRAVSCVTWIIAGLATSAVIGAATLATVTASLVVGAVEATAKMYGIRASFHTRFLATVWIAAAFAIAAGFFWIFTICCCAPEKRPHVGRNKHRGEQGEKMLPTGAYQPLHEPEHNGFYNSNNNNSNVAYGAPRYPSGGRSDMAYEPYSHSRV